MNEHGGVVPIEELIKISKKREEPIQPEKSRDVENNAWLAESDSEE